MTRPPDRTIRERVFAEALGSELDAQAGRARQHVASVSHLDRLHEVPVQVLGVLGDAVLERATHGDVVERRIVLEVFAETGSIIAGPATDSADLLIRGLLHSVLPLNSTNRQGSLPATLSFDPRRQIIGE